MLETGARGTKPEKKSAANAGGKAGKDPPKSADPVKSADSMVTSRNSTLSGSKSGRECDRGRSGRARYPSDPQARRPGDRQRGGECRGRLGRRSRHALPAGPTKSLPSRKWLKPRPSRPISRSRWQSPKMARKRRWSRCWSLARRRKLCRASTPESAGQVEANQQPSTGRAAKPTASQPEPKTEGKPILPGRRRRQATSAQARSSHEAGASALSLDGVDYSASGDIIFSGRATSGTAVRLYVDNKPVGDSIVGAKGTWTFSGQQSISPGKHTLRADQIDANGKVLAASNCRSCARIQRVMR